MKHPILFSLKVQAKSEIRQKQVHFYVRPSMYYSALYSHHMKNFVDCKAYGVYHLHKFAVSYPFEIKASFENLTSFEISYKIPELPKKIFYSQSEAGTYAGEEKLDKHPSCCNREPIRTIPTQFKKSKTFVPFGLPAFEIEMNTEDMNEGMTSHPNNWEDVVHQVTLFVRNAGWRRKSLNISCITMPNAWPKDNEVTLRFSYNQSQRNIEMPKMQNEWYHQDSSQDDDDSHMHSSQEPHMQWSAPKLSDSEDTIVAEAKKLYKKMKEVLPHIYHEWEIHMESTPAQCEAHMRMEYNHTFDKVSHTFAVFGKAKSPLYRTPLKFSVSNIMRFEEMPNEFEYNPRQYGKQRCYFYNGLNFKTQEMFTKPDVMSHGNLYYRPPKEIIDKESVEEHKSEYFLPETHEECESDVKEGKPLSDDCMLAVKELSIYNRLDMTIKWKQDLSPLFRNITSKIERAYRHYHFHHVSVNDVDVRNEERTIEMTVEIIDKLIDEPIWDVFLKKPTENIHFHNIEPWCPALSSVYDYSENVLQEFTNNTIKATCALTEKFVRTYDREMYEMPENQCTYVMSTHCTDRKKFAVLAKVLPRGTKEINMYIAQHEFTLLPESRNGYKVKFNGREYEITQKHPMYFDEETGIHAYIQPLSSSSSRGILVVHADVAGVKVHYDGKNVKLQVDPRYKGELCGLCSEYDGEQTREYIGVDQCQYANPQDFAKSCIVNPSSCRVDSTPTGPVFCRWSDKSSDIYDRLSTPAYSEDDYDHETNVPTLQRNVVKKRNDFICFSTKPVPVCEDEATPARTESMEVDFHCLPKRDVTANKLMAEAKRRILTELANKSVDFTEVIQVAKSC